MKSLKIFLCIITSASLWSMNDKIVEKNDIKSIEKYDEFPSSESHDPIYGSDNPLEIKKTLTDNHEDLFKYIGLDIRTDVIDVLKDKRMTLFNSVTNQTPLITQEEFNKSYGEEGLKKINAFMQVGKAFLHVMSDHYKEEKNKVENKARLVLATLHNALDSCENYVDTKFNEREISIKGCCFGRAKKVKVPSKKKDLQQPLLKPSKTDLIVDPEKQDKPIDKDQESKKEALIKVLKKNYGSIIRFLPNSYSDSDDIITKFMDQYPQLARQLTNSLRKNRDIPLDSAPNQTQVVNVQSIENNLLQNQDVSNIYEKYKVLKGVLEAVGINMDGLQDALNQQLQVLVNNLTNRLNTLGDTIAQDLSVVVENISNNCCKKTN